MPAARPAGGQAQELRRVLGQVACTRSGPYLSQPLCGTRKRCIRSSYPSGKSAPVWAVCTRTAHRCRNSGTACSNATRSYTSDIFQRDQSQPRALLHNSSSALALPCPPSSVCEGQGDPWRHVVRPAAASVPCPFFRVFPAFRHHDSRGDRTCDPQTPPSVSRNGL